MKSTDANVPSHAIPIAVRTQPPCSNFRGHLPDARAVVSPRCRLAVQPLRRGREHVFALDLILSIAIYAAVVDGKKQNLSGANVKAVTMADGANQPLAIPSAIGGDGSSFSVTRTSNPGTNTGTGGRSPGRRRG